jgi:RecA-family ATPase
MEPRYPTIREGEDFSDVPLESVLEVNEAPPGEWFVPDDPATKRTRPLEWIVEGFAARRRVTLIAGPPGSGKSFLIQLIFQNQENVLFNVKRCKAVFFTEADSGEEEICQRAQSIGRNDGLMTVPLPDEELHFITREPFFSKIEEKIIHYGFDVVIFDTVADFHEGKSHDPDDVRRTMADFRELAKRTNAAVILITHTRKGTRDKLDYSTDDVADSRLFATKSDFVFGLRSEYQDEGNNLIELQTVKKRTPIPIPKKRMELGQDAPFLSLSSRRFKNEILSQTKEEQISERDKQIVQLHKEGKSYHQIAVEVGYDSKTSVQTRLIKHGIVHRSKDIVKVNTERTNTLPFTEPFTDE